MSVTRRDMTDGIPPLHLVVHYRVVYFNFFDFHKPHNSSTSEYSKLGTHEGKGYMEG